MRWTSVVLVLLATRLASAAELATEVSELDTAVAARIVEIGAPAPRSAAAIETAKLAAARLQLARYHGLNDVPDFKALAATGRLIVASRTANRIYGEYEDRAFYFDLTSYLLRLFPDDATAPHFDGRIVVTLRGHAAFTIQVALALE